MIKRIAFIVYLLISSNLASAAIWSDMWWDPNNPGWGLQIAQQKNILVLTLYSFDNYGYPVWYVADLRPSNQTSSVYSGELWAAKDKSDLISVGTVSFSPTSAYAADLSLTNSTGTSTNKITRMNFAESKPDGAFLSVLRYEYNSGCGSESYKHGVENLTNTISTSGTGFTSKWTIDGGVCNITGTWRQSGSLFYGLGNISCSGENYPIEFVDWSKDDDGMSTEYRIKWSNTCSERGKIAGVNN